MAHINYDPTSHISGVSASLPRVRVASLASLYHVSAEGAPQTSKLPIDLASVLVRPLSSANVISQQVQRLRSASSTAHLCHWTVAGSSCTMGS